ncbi:MAG: PRC-barrel domain containing protein [Chloroflexi bacterium]|nr:MAG: PRC-barrel domain containing protein [Chloroflexota bacterium]
MQIELDAKVRTSDGHDAGKLRRVLVDPATLRITGFVVSTGGLLGREVIVVRLRVERVPRPRSRRRRAGHRVFATDDQEGRRREGPRRRRRRCRGRGPLRREDGAAQRVRGEGRRRSAARGWWRHRGDLRRRRPPDLRGRGPCRGRSRGDRSVGTGERYARGLAPSSLRRSQDLARRIGLQLRDEDDRRPPREPTRVRQVRRRRVGGHARMEPVRAKRARRCFRLDLIRRPGHDDLAHVSSVFAGDRLSLQ